MHKRKAKLPHDRLGTTPIHLTYRLAGSLPKTIFSDLKRRRERKLMDLESRLLDVPDERRTREFNLSISEINAHHEQAIDAALHATSGPYHLNNPKIAKLVLDSWQYIYATGKIYLYVVCVMSNHVHLILQAPEGVDELDMGKVVKAHKTFTAGQANKLLGRTGQSFWATNYFDRRVRSGKFFTAMWYVLKNPVKAGLVDNWKEWPNTWLNPEYAEVF
ncbi:hypothetical protein CEQ90_12750 [Lewinellaceae bacterium SD302]|nr:hypothetical protein CEQ90_12750 [Lewinellaceae bacterium SD302]